MAEQFLTLMADLDEGAQEKMTGWYHSLTDAGFKGTQTPGLPYHISLATFSVDKEAEVKAEMDKLAAEFAQITVHISHIGLFAGGRVLFGAPDMNPPGLLALHNAIRTETVDQFQFWTPHATILIDEPETIQKALPILVSSFSPFAAKITRLHLCAFWPTREIAAVDLKERTAGRNGAGVRVVSARDAARIRQAVCEAQFEKAKQLLAASSPENERRACEIMENLATKFEYAPAVMWMGEYAENVKQDLLESVYWYKKANVLGEDNGTSCHTDAPEEDAPAERNSWQALQHYAAAGNPVVPAGGLNAAAAAVKKDGSGLKELLKKIRR